MSNGTESGASAEIAPLDRKRILLVDDEKPILQIFRLILSVSIPGCKIDLASNGAEAVDAFCNARHAVLLMDLHMPVKDGLTAFLDIQALCESRRWEMPSVVFCTGFAPPSSLSNLISKSTTHGLLLKPVRNEILVEAVKSRLK